MDSRRQPPPAPPEKDRYTYDEMMERLRHQRSSGGSRRVRVETSDGTVEVRKRKRRTHQPKKELRERMGRLKKTLLLAGGSTLLLLVGAYLLINVRYQSDSFRSSVSERASELIGSKTELAPMEIKGLTVRSRRMFIDPGSDHLLQDAEFTSLNGKFTAGSLLSSDWHLTNLNALHGKLRFHAPARSLASAASDHRRSQLVGAGLGISGKPSAFNIENLHVGSTDFAWSTGLKEFIFLENATLSSTQIGAETELLITDAKLRFEGWPEFDVEEAKASFTTKGIRVEDAILQHSFIGNLGGEATLNGKIDLSSSAPLANFVCEFYSMPAESLVASEWRSKLDGDIDATLNFGADLSAPGSLQVSGPFHIRNGSFGDITPTKRLVVFLAEPRLSRVQFQSIRGKITLAGGSRIVEDIDASVPRFLHVRGRYEIQADGILSGTLEVSIADDILNKISGGKPKFFGETDPNGMSSTTVQLGGTSREPIEDLSPRLEAALEKYRIESAAPPASSYPTIPLAPGAKNSEPTDEARKRAEEALKKLIEP